MIETEMRQTQATGSRVKKKLKSSNIVTKYQDEEDPATESRLKSSKRNVNNIRILRHSSPPRLMLALLVSLAIAFTCVGQVSLQLELQESDEHETRYSWAFTQEDGDERQMMALASGESLQSKRNDNNTRQMTKRAPPALKVSGTELIPFEEFVVRQPAFSDLMKTWPPSTRQVSGKRQANAETQSSQHSSSTYEKRLRQRQRQHQNQATEPDEWPNGPVKNHLKEDIDDTIITADQSFEKDQTPEPPTLVNYLGEMSDYIYSQLVQGSESQAQEESRAQTQAQSQSQSQGNSTSGSQSPIGDSQSRHKSASENVEDILDDFYYDQYENSQVLYYGSQLVREGDLFEIGCYLPNDQPAEWTKSGKPLELNGRPSLVKRSDFLGAKQNFSLKFYEASLVSK